MEHTQKPKLNPIWALVLVYFKFIWYCVRHGGSGKGAWIDFDTAEITPAD